MRRMLTTLCTLLALAAAAAGIGPAAHGQSPHSPSPPGARVYFVNLKDGATLPPNATIRFGVEGMRLVPASVDEPNTGHHHLIIDSETTPLDRELPSDRKHLHFGSGQTEAEIELPPGKHTLQLVFGDANHIPHDPPVVSERITVTVRPGGAAAR